MLRDEFIECCLQYTSKDAALELWREIEMKYAHKKRHYHNIFHLENMLAELQGAKHLIEDWNTVIFSVVYHDIVYRATSKDNEEKSAHFANERLSKLGYPTVLITKCADMIMATKAHGISDSADINLLTDSDLSILGKPWEKYELYFQQVRREYSIFPDFLYRPGRRKALTHLLGLDPIFKSAYFQERYEASARENMTRELDLLTKK